MGESGSGKSTLALSILRLVPSPGRIVDGKILFRGNDLLTADDDTVRKVRGKEISMVFQNPLSALNPLMTIGEQLAEVIKLHRNTPDNVMDMVTSILDIVGFPDARLAVRKFPHELSGGMNQRALIAMAISCEPSFMICDEPTSALDVSTQAQILNLLVGMRDRYGMSLLMITHNPGVIAETCDRVAVMYGGKIVEIGAVNEIFSNPRHPYTRGLIKSMVHIDKKVETFQTIQGEVSSVQTNSLCRFLPRCSAAVLKCQKITPPLIETSPGHHALCHRAEDKI
jgi:peptide/nickel transport system ATP-binding protein